MSAGENTVLSQADIDALVSKARGNADQERAPAPAESPRTAPAPAPAVGAAPQGAGGAPASGETQAPAAAAAPDVLQRLERLEAALSRMSQSQDTQVQLQTQLTALANRLQAVSSRVDEILRYLPSTLGYGVRATFTCSSCGVQGLVAAPVVCTHCGQQTYVGWWSSS